MEEVDEKTKQIWDASTSWGKVTISDIDMVKVLQYVVLQYAFMNIGLSREKKSE